MLKHSVYYSLHTSSPNIQNHTNFSSVIGAAGVQNEVHYMVHFCNKHWPLLLSTAKTEIFYRLRKDRNRLLLNRLPVYVIMDDAKITVTVDT